MEHEHKGEIFPGAAERKFAYQDETAYPGAFIVAYSPKAGPREKYGKYELRIQKHTDTAFVVELQMNYHCTSR